MRNLRSAKSKIAVIVAVLTFVVTALGGTYAYNDFKQHKSNELGGSMIRYEARLVEEFEEVSDWTTGMGAVKKDISVVNKGRAEAGFGDVYVRIALKEYMEIGSVSYIETPQRYMIDTKGDFIVYATETAAQAAVAPGGTYAGHAFMYLTDIVTDTTGYFIRTQDRDPNGQMGKHVVTGIEIGDPKKVIDPGADRALSTNHHSGARDANGHISDECKYAIHSWKTGSELQTREYVEWGLNEAEIITMTKWLDPADTYKGKPVSKWIKEDRDNSGWVYWGEALKTGVSTAKFMNSVTLIKQPNGSFYYTIHTELDAVSFDDLWEGDFGDNMRDNVPWLKFTSPTPAQVEVGKTAEPPSVQVGPAGAAQQPLTWTSSNTALATVNPTGIVSGKAAGGPVTISVKAPNGATGSYKINVVTGEIKATDVEITGSSATIDVGEDYDVQYVVTPLNTTDPLNWSSSQPAIATVTPAVGTGTSKVTVKGLSPGTTTVSVTVNGKSDFILITVRADDKLPVVDKPNGFDVIKNDDDPDESDGYYAKIYYPDLNDAFNNEFVHNGFFHLEDIITDGNYNNVTIRAIDTKYAGFLSIVDAQDHTCGTPPAGHKSIMYSYKPANQEWKDWNIANGDDFLTIPIQVELERGGKKATIKLNLYYGDCLAVVDWS